MRASAHHCDRVSGLRDHGRFYVVSNICRVLGMGANSAEDELTPGLNEQKLPGLPKK